MDLIKNILSHFQKNNTKKPAPITINEVTIQQINKDLQKNNNEERNDEQLIETDVPPSKKLKKNSDKSEKCNNSTEAKVSLMDNPTANNDANNMMTDLTNCPNSSNAQDMLEINEATENSTITKLPDDTKTIVLINDENIEFKYDENKDNTVCEDVTHSDYREKSVPDNTKIYNIIIDDHSKYNNLQNSRNILKVEETTENSKITDEDNIPLRTLVSVSHNNTTIDETESTICTNNLQTKPVIVTDNLENNYDNTKATTEFIKEFEDILANVENELTLDPEITLDDVNDLISDLTFDSDDEIQISDIETQIPIHIFGKNAEIHIPTDLIGFCYDLEVKSVDSKNPIETDNSYTERDAKINKTTNDCDKNATINTKTEAKKDSKINTVGKLNDKDIKPDDIIKTNNGNTKANITANKTDTYDTISLSSDDHISISDSSETDCGYHSSDFEFITEDEAKREGLMINFKLETIKNKECTLTSDSRRPKIETITYKRKKNQVKVPTNFNIPVSSKNIQAGRSKFRAGSINPVQSPSTCETGPNKHVQMSSNLHAESINPDQRPLICQAGTSNPVQGPLKVGTRPNDAVQFPSNIQARPSYPIQGPSNVQVGLSNAVQIPSNLQVGPINPVQRPLNVQTGPSNPIQGPSNCQAGSSNAVKGPSNIQGGPSNPIQEPSNIQAGPSNPIQGPSNIQARPSNPIQGPSNIQARPSNSVQGPSNVQPNYESYRNKYKKQFQYDSSYRNRHIEPQGDGYMDLFRGFHAGLYPMYTRENKSLTPHFGNPTRMWCHGVGFDGQMIRCSSDEEDPEFKDEARETIQKITTVYPAENRKPRRFREK